MTSAQKRKKTDDPRYATIPFSPGSEEEEEEYYRRKRAEREATIREQYMPCPHCSGTGMIERRQEQEPQP